MRSLNVTVRQKLDLYACVRPVRWFEGVPSPVKRPPRTKGMTGKIEAMRHRGIVPGEAIDLNAPRPTSDAIDNAEESAVPTPTESEPTIPLVSAPSRRLMLPAGALVMVDTMLRPFGATTNGLMRCVPTLVAES